jgi:hypothetical protein
LIAPEARPSKAAVRAALLSARLYHDTLGDKSMLRYAGFGVLEPERAFDILKRDSETPNPYVPWLSLYRLGLAYETFRATSDKWLRPIAINAVDLKVRAALCAPDLLMVAARPWWKKLLPARAPKATGTANSRALLANFRNWNTTVTPNSDGSTVVVTEMEVRAPFRRLALMCDPRQWQNVSLFWYESKVVDGPRGDPPSIGNPNAKPQPWSGTLREKVAGMGVLTVLLGIDYKVNEIRNVCTVDYEFICSPDSSLCLDNGRMIVEPTKDDGWLHTHLDKHINFERALFGGLSSADLLAPSFIGTWMRVQQDFWAAYATGWQQPDDASHSS